MSAGKAVWTSRTRSYYREIFPYVHDVVKSGFPPFLLFGFMVLSIVYASWVRNLPADLPVYPVAMAVLAPLMSISPLRTFLKPADLVFLLTFERHMKPYFLRSAVFSMAIQTVIVLIGYTAVLPLMLHAGSFANLQIGLLLAAIVIGKGINLHAQWTENQLALERHRIIFRVLRWCINLAAIGALFHFDPLKSIPFFFLLQLLYSASLRLAPRFHFNWRRLVDLELRHRARVFAFFAWFSEVPELEPAVRGRSLLVKWFEPGSFSRDAAYTYLYVRTFFRLDLFGIALRFSLFSVLVEAVVPWAGVRMLAYWMLVFLLGLQLSVLEKAHRSQFWPGIYPLQEALRIRSAIRLYAGLLRVFALVLLLPQLMLSTSLAGAAQTAMAAAAGLAIIELQKAHFRKKWLQR